MANQLSRLDANLQFNKAVKFLNDLGKIASDDKTSGNIGFLKGKIVRKCSSQNGIAQLKMQLTDALSSLSRVKGPGTTDIAQRMISTLTVPHTNARGKDSFDKAAVKSFLNDVNTHFFENHGIQSLDQFDVNEFSIDEIAEAKMAVEDEWDAAHANLSDIEKKAAKFADKTSHDILAVLRSFEKGEASLKAAPKGKDPKHIKHFKLKTNTGYDIKPDTYNNLKETWGTDLATIRQNLFRQLKAVLEKKDDDPEKISLVSFLTARLSDDANNILATAIAKSFKSSLSQMAGMRYNNNNNNVKAGLAYDCFRGCTGGGTCTQATLNKNFKLLEAAQKPFTEAFRQKQSTIKKFGTSENPKPLYIPDGVLFMDENGKTIIKPEKKDQNIFKAESARIIEELSKMLPEEEGYEGLLYIMTTALSLSNPLNFQPEASEVDFGYGSFIQRASSPNILANTGGVLDSRALKTDISIDDKGEFMTITQEGRFDPGSLTQLNGNSLPNIENNAFDLKVTIRIPMASCKDLQPGTLPPDTVFNVETAPAKPRLII